MLPTNQLAFEANNLVKIEVVYRTCRIVVEESGQPYPGVWQEGLRVETPPFLGRVWPTGIVPVGESGGSCCNINGLISSSKHQCLPFRKTVVDATGNPYEARTFNRTLTLDGVTLTSADSAWTRASGGTKTKLHLTPRVKKGKHL
jgi:hypothetical protein